MKFAYFFLFSWLGLVGIAQTPIYPNPSPCGDLGNIKDFSCPDNSGYYQPNRFIIRVLDAPGNQLGVNVYLKEVRLILTHSWLADIEIRLVSPAGKSVLLSADNGSGEDNYGVPSAACTAFTSFSIASCTPIPATGAPYTDQPYLPKESLLGFNEDASSPIGDWTLIVCDDTEQDTGRLEFVELVFEPMTCLPVRQVQVLDQDTTAVVVHWTPNTACTPNQTFIEYGSKGFQPGTGDVPGQFGQIVRAGCPPFTLTGLAPDTDYDIYIRSACGLNSISENTCVLPVRTRCLPPGPSVTEHFDRGTVCTPLCSATCAWEGIWQNDADSAIDWILYAGETPTEGTGPSDAVDPGGKYIYLESSGSACTGTAILRSGCFELHKQQTDECHLSFSYHLFGENIGTLRLEASSDGITWDTLWQRKGQQAASWLKAYISLGAYAEGTLLQFRFVATLEGGSLGDIALDAITLHGSTYLGLPAFTYYADNDGDGYGNADAPIHTCREIPDPGYVLLGQDCEDDNPLIHPGAPEIPCDGVDNNCNGLEDDVSLPPPMVFNDTICSGEQPLLWAEPVPNAFILWYDSPTATSGVFAPDGFRPIVPANTGSTPQIYRFYAQVVDEAFRCYSTPFTEAILVVNPVPQGVIGVAPAFCSGDTVNIERLDIRDVRLTGAAIQFHRGLPVSEDNRLEELVLTPAESLPLAYALISPAGCVFSDSFILAKRVAPAVQLLPADSFSLCVGSSRRVEVQPLPTQGSPYRYLWNTGSEDPLAEVVAGLEAGVRRYAVVQVTDAYGCTAKDSVLYYSTSSIDSLRRQIYDVSACNRRDGRIELRPLDGIPPFTYTWSGSNGTGGVIAAVETIPFVLSDLAQGSYRITITDSSNEQCGFIMPTAYVNGPGIGVTAVRVDPPRCAGDSTGSICVDLGGTGMASFQWSTGDSTACVSGLSSGAYTVTISVSGCSTVLKEIVVPEPTPLRIVAERIPASCSDSRDGAIRLTVFGGAGGYRYRWSTGRLTKDIQGLLPGTYTVTVTDAEGCTLVETIGVGMPTPLSIAVDSLRPMRCVGEQNGYVQVSGSGGTPPYRVAWQDGQVGFALDNVQAGLYAATLTDYLGCTVSKTIELEAPTPFSAAIRTIASPVCKGDSSGILRVVFQGGSAPYRVVWNTGAGTSELDRVSIGTYWAVASDTYGCQSDTLRVSVIAPETLTWNAVLSPPFCPGRSDGSIQLTPTGRAPFRFHWMRGDTLSRLNGLSEGAYGVEVTDAKGCIYDTIFNLVAPAAPFEVSTRTIAPTCAGGADGLIFLQPRLVSFPPLRYRWQDGVSTRDRMALTEGNYAVTVTDAMGCVVSMQELELNSPEPLTYTLLSEGAIRCTGDSTGFLELEVQGGESPYTFQWQGTSATTASVYNLSAGTYTVFIQDARGCPKQASFLLEAPATLEAQIAVQSGNICLGDTQVQVNALISGGVPPYDLKWSNGKTEPVLYNPLPGDYGLAIRDSKGCQKQVASVKVRDIGQPLQLKSFNTLNISCFGKKDGVLTATISGGTAPYTYIFNGTSRIIRTNDMQYTVSGLGVGASYAVVVTDALGCRVESAPSAITEPAILEAVLDSTRNVSCTGLGFGALYVTAKGGTPPFAFNWFERQSGREVATTEDLISFERGLYDLVVTDIRLCTDSLQSVPITGNSSVGLKRVLVNPIACKGDSTGSVLIELEGGRPPYRTLWNGQPGGLVLGNLPTGMYQPVVIDADSCRTEFPPIVLPEPPAVLEVAEHITPVSCMDRADGSIEVGITGGKAPYRLSWQHTSGQVIKLDVLKIDHLTSGRYNLVIRDSAQCLKAFTYQVPTAAPLEVAFKTEPPSGAGSDGLVEALVTGGTMPYRFLWNTGDTSAGIHVLSAGMYKVTVTDFRVCSIQDSIRLIPTAMQAFWGLEGVKLYPNPVNQHLWVDIEFQQAPVSLRLVITDVQGRVLHTEILPAAPTIHQDVYLPERPAEGVLVATIFREGVTVWSGLLMVHHK